MSIIIATQDELTWINEQYKKIGFVPSNIENETIAIISYKGQYAGVGRLVYLNEEEAELGGIYILNAFRGLLLAYELVDYLVKEARNSRLKELYCIPFEELQNFYSKFGFQEFDHDSKSINNHIVRKYQWCLEHYEKKCCCLNISYVNRNEKI
jgi:N-acetylglutamate synthase-like GNAT family acetyltransferase